MLGVNTRGSGDTLQRSMASSDSVMTPDFRILLAGPANFIMRSAVTTHGKHLRAAALFPATRLRAIIF